MSHPVEPDFPCGILRPLPPYETLHIFIDSWQACSALPTVVAHEHWLVDADGSFKQCTLRSYWCLGPATAAVIALRQAATCVEMLVRYSRMPDGKRVVLEFSDTDAYLLAIGAFAWRSSVADAAGKAFRKRLTDFFEADPSWVVDFKLGNPDRLNALRRYRNKDMAQAKRRKSSLYDFDVVRLDAEKNNAAFRERLGLWRGR